MKSYMSTIAACLFTVCAWSQEKAESDRIAVAIKDIPTVDWGTTRDTLSFGINNVTLNVGVTSRLPLENVELRINQIVTENFTEAGLAASRVGKNSYHQLIERDVNLRTGINVVEISAKNVKGRSIQSTRIFNVDPKLITVLRNEKDLNPPQLYIANPPNIRNAHFAYSGDLIQIKGSVFDDAGIRSLKVNGTVTPVRLNGSFTITIILTMGENFISIEAEDVNQNIAVKKFVIERRDLSGDLTYDPKNSTNHLFVVGIDSYKNWPKLNNAVKDAQDLVSVLSSKYKFEPENITLLTNENATRNNIYDGLRKLIEKVTPNDNLLIYFSGHGMYDDLLKEGYWIPVEAGRSPGEYLPNSSLIKILENIDAKHMFLVADACFSGSLFATQSRGYIENVERFRSRWGLASGRLEVVSDGAVGTNSPFAQTFINFLDSTPEDRLAVSEIIQHVKRVVAEISDQTPYGNPLKIAGDEGGEFVFYKRE